MHNAALASLGLDWAYVPFDVDPDPVNVEAALAGLRALGLIGVNVTVPLKEAVLPHVVVSGEAARVGSVNTIHNRDGRLYGYSTDGAGFVRALEAAGQASEARRVLLLGAGGSARAVAFALAARGCHCRIANRTRPRAVRLAEDICGHFPGAASVAGWGADAGAFDLLVNTTSLGLHPDEAAVPALPPEAFAARPFVYDLIYTPPQTALLRMAGAAGCGTSNGVGMLVHQGALALALWTGIPVEDLPVAAMERAVRRSLGAA